MFTKKLIGLVALSTAFVFLSSSSFTKNEPINKEYVGTVSFGNSQGRMPLSRDPFIDSNSKTWSWSDDGSMKSVTSGDDYSMIGSESEGGPTSCHFETTLGTESKSVYYFKVVCDFERNDSESTGGEVVLKVGDTQVASKTITFSGGSSTGFSSVIFENGSQLGNKLSIDIETKPQSGHVYMKIQSIEYKYSGNEYTVKFNNQGKGVAPEDISAEEGTTITKPTDPTTSGYTFTGWFKEAECTNAWNFSSDKITKNITLYARWFENPQGKAVGGYILNGKEKKQVVAFGFNFSNYGNLNADDRIGIYVYSDGGGSSVIREFVTTNVAAVQQAKGNFYCVYYPDVKDTTYYAKAYVTTVAGHNAYTSYSNMFSAKGNDKTHLDDN